MKKIEPLDYAKFLPGEIIDYPKLAMRYNDILDVVSPLVNTVNELVEKANWEHEIWKAQLAQRVEENKAKQARSKIESDYLEHQRQYRATCSHLYGGDPGQPFNKFCPQCGEKLS